MIDLAAAYSETHEHLVEVLRGLPEDMLARTVEATPDWDVRDAIAHVTAEAHIAATGDAQPDLNLLESLRDQEQADRRDAWNAREVQSRRGRPLDAVLEEWAGLAGRLAPMLRGEEPFPYEHPFLGAIVVTDLAMHTQDVRTTVGVPGDRESAGVGVALAAFSYSLDMRLRALGVLGLRVRYGEKVRVLGEEPVGATVTADRFDLVRALAGRRSSAQIRAMQWEGDPEPYVPVIPAYGERDDDIIE
ncbi:MAG: maleylpyruvate isomerase family mycothiol-dependent enzyme [Actinomycetota bacterium]|nr:maleylpyruvate isomerase family mycothiol-dependent enzyme [Actinomycetota bacterium]